MKLIDHLKTFPRPERESFAVACGSTLGHLQNIGYGYKPCSAALAVAIERVSGGAVTRPELVPEWRDIWPELANAVRG